MTDTKPTKAMDLPRYHVWLADDDGEHRYVGEVTIRNVDQLTAETQAKAVNVNMRTQPFHLTNLWLWAACVRLEETDLRFRPFTERLEWTKVGEDGEGEVPEVDPTTTDPGVSTG